MSNHEVENSYWNNIDKIGGVAALCAVLVGVIEILINFTHGGNAVQEKVLDWFMLFQENWFMELRNPGLLNIILNTLAILAYFVIYASHLHTAYRPYAALALIISFLGIAVFYATNRAFPMLEFSNQYLAAGTDA